MALGDGIEAGAQVSDSAIEDVCPSLLYAMGEAVPEGLDGRVLENCWSAQWREQNPLTSRRAGARSAAARGAGLGRPAPSRPTADGLEERLAALGYLDVR